MSQERKPETPVVFTEMEAVENSKMVALVQQNFMKLHPEITSPAQSDLAKMMRDEKMMYANLGIQFTVQYIAATVKSKKS